ncbi:MAG TPA: response regulator [Polyangia bacterium]|nr:response regulator [Polyangia bacterium]
MKPKLMIVDDEPALGEVLEAMFARRGYRVVQLDRGEAVHARALAERPSAILLDVHLPDVDGWEVCRRLKADPRTRRIPILMMTAEYATVADAERGLGIGADEYVAKPFLRDVLLHNVERLVRRAA